MLTLQRRDFLNRTGCASEHLMSNFGKIFNMPANNVDDTNKKQPAFNQGDIEDFTKFLELQYFSASTEKSTCTYPIKIDRFLNNSVYDDDDDVKLRVRYDDIVNEKGDSEDSHTSSIEDGDEDDIEDGDEDEIEIDLEIGAFLEIHDSSRSMDMDEVMGKELFKSEQNQYQSNENINPDEDKICEDNANEIEQTPDISAAERLHDDDDDDKCCKNPVAVGDDDSSENHNQRKSEKIHHALRLQYKNKKTTDKLKRKPIKPRSTPNRCIHMWEFLKQLLENEEFCPKVISWTSKESGEFRLVDTQTLARLWGAKKNKTKMTYEKMSRALRYYYQLHILERVPNKRLHFRFGKATVWKL